MSHVQENLLFAYPKTEVQICAFVFTSYIVQSLLKSEILSLESPSVVVKPGLCRVWLETWKTGFLAKPLTIE